MFHYRTNSKLFRVSEELSPTLVELNQTYVKGISTATNRKVMCYIQGMPTLNGKKCLFKTLPQKKVTLI